jgi:AcrR family transcriptional regulator
MSETLSSEKECYIRSVFDTGKKQQQKAAATRKALLRAAKDVFVRDGFAASRIEDIAAEAGRTRGAFYANFKGKEEAFFALLEEELAEIERSAIEAVSVGSTLPERRKLARGFFTEKVFRNPENIILRLEFKLYAVRRPQVHKQLAETERTLKQRVNFEELARLLTSEDGESPVDEETRTALEALVDGMGLALAFDPERISDLFAHECLGEWFDLLVGGKLPESLQKSKKKRKIATAQAH